MLAFVDCWASQCLKAGRLNATVSRATGDILRRLRSLVWGREPAVAHRGVAVALQP